MHGFPDDSRIYGRLVPLLDANRVITFDWRGYGRSERGDADSRGWLDHQHQLGALLDAHSVDDVVLVGHDASGPEAIDYALGNPTRVRNTILLNTYYGHAPSLRLPDVIRLLADPELADLAAAMLEDEAQRLWLLQHTARAFGEDPFDPLGIGFVSVLPQFFGDPAQPDALSTIRAWTRTLFPSLDRQDGVIAAGRTVGLARAVSFIFGERDCYLSPDLAAHLSGLFGDAPLHLVSGASHWPQWDQPETVAHLIADTVSPNG
jgi:pimeloyl-ACP methyl ester carboxylesterase